MKRSLNWLRAVIPRKQEIKDKSKRERSKLVAARVLNRIVTVAKDGLEQEGHHRHAEMIVYDLGLKDDRGGVVTPGIHPNWRRKRGPERGE
jgi:hypothetical protein